MVKPRSKIQRKPIALTNPNSVIVDPPAVVAARQKLNRQIAARAARRKETSKRSTPAEIRAFTEALRDTHDLFRKTHGKRIPFPYGVVETFRANFRAKNKRDPNAKELGIILGLNK